MLSIQYGLATDVGKIRSDNQDGVYAIASHVAGEHGQSSVGLFMVLDGMGGQGTGVQATYLAIETIKAHLIPFLFTPSVELTSETIQAEIRQALEKANTAIIETSLPAGCVVTLAVVYDKHLYIGHVGDTRASIVGDKGVSQITREHSIPARLVELGQITEEEAKLQGKNLYRILGASSILHFDDGKDIFELQLLPDQILMLCSDGLWWRGVDYSELHNIILQNADNLQAACNRLVELANERGGEDNIAVILIKISEDE